MRLRSVWLAPVTAIAGLACGSSNEASPRDSIAVAQPHVVAESRRPVGNENSNPCPHTGKWALCTLERRMRQSGFVAKRIDGERPDRSGFSVSPTVYSLGRSRLEVFLYEDEAGLARDIAGLDTVLVSPRGSAKSQWESSPTFIRSGNLAAVLLTSSPLQAERLALAITAGAPQPGSPR